MNGTWWGRFDFAPGDMRAWRLGPLEMWIARTAAEYRVSLRRDPEGDPSGLRAGEIVTDPAPAEAETTRFGVRESARRLDVTPATADRAVIVKAETDFIVPPGGMATAFISSPLWIQVHMTDPKRPLVEVPSHRPSDTWFGPNTIAGELCYAVRTSVRFDLAKLPVWPYRAVSVIRVFNHADTPLPLARIRLPLPFLSLFADGAGRLWTEAVTLNRHGSDDLAEVKLGKAAPREAGSCMRVAGPRAEMESRHLIRSFTGLLGLRKGGEGYERVVE